MIENLVALTERVNQVLAEENALLDALDLPGATALLARKREAVAALQAAIANGGTTTSADISNEADKLRVSLQRLASLGEANRAAIERGLSLQMRLIYDRAGGAACPRTGRAGLPAERQPASGPSPGGVCLSVTDVGADLEVRQALARWVMPPALPRRVRGQCSQPDGNVRRPPQPFARRG